MTGPIVAALDGHHPRIAPDAWLAPTAVVVGRVWIGPGSSVWYGAVLRAEDADVVLGAGCNVQDCSVLHADPGFPCVLGDRVSLGHRAVVHGARIDDDVLVGMGAVVLNGGRVGSWSVVAAGAVLRPGFEVPAGVLVAGVPAKVVRPVTDAERDMVRLTAAAYRHKSDLHRAAFPA
ncbi:MAG TPA: gamma carbonic anhydrase family protein [Mycobacteriales bacterium]|nr:gamma carbonic anhydrase family protein [Mycobacteriales bacterium]